MVQVSVSTSTTFDGEANALIEDQNTALTVNFNLDEPAPVDGLKVFVDSNVEQIVNRLDLPGFAFNPVFENINPNLVGTSFDNSGFFLTIDEGATTASFTIDVFDNPEPDTFLPETFDGLVEANFALVAPGEVEDEDLADVGTLGDYTIDSNAASSTVLFADTESQLEDIPSPPEPPEPPTPPIPEGLQVSLFTGPDYLIEDEGTVSAHAFNVTNGTIPEGGLVVSVDAPNLSEFDLDSVSVEGGEIIAVRDDGFDLRMTQYTALVNLAVAEDGEAETGETASFSLATGSGYEIIEDYSGGTFNLVDTAADIPQGETTEPSQTIPSAIDTKISAENPSFSATDSIYFDIGSRYLNEDGTYTYIDYSEDVDVYQVDLSAGDTIAVETFDFDTNPDGFETGGIFTSQIYDAEGNPVRDYRVTALARDRFTQAAPDKLFGGVGPFDPNETDSYQEFTAPEDGSYYIAIAGGNTLTDSDLDESIPPAYDPFIPGTGTGNRTSFGDYRVEIDLITEDNPRKTGTPTPPVSNPDVVNPPTLSLSASPTTVDSDGSFTNAVVENVEIGGISSIDFTIEAEGEIPEGGIEFVLNSDANLFDYVALIGQNRLPQTIGGQSLGAFYNEDGIPTGIRLRIEEPRMTVNYVAANPQAFAPGFIGTDIYEEFEPLETDGAEDVTFFLQSGEGYEVNPDSGTTEITYYDSLADVPPPTGSGNTVPEVGVTVSETTLIETEGTETTLTFNLSEPPPEGGLTIYLDSEDEAVLGSVLSQFDVLNAEITGGDFPVANGDESGFFFNITEQTATITLSVFDELTAGTGLEPETFQEGILNFNFALQPQSGYTIDSNASGIGITIADNPDSQIQVSLTGSTEADEDSNTLIESEGTVSIHTFNLGAPPPEGGLTVSVSADSLDDFDLDAIEVTGGTIAEVRDDGFDLTITEREAVIRLPILEDSTNEGTKTATFTLEPGDNYEVTPTVDEASFVLADTLDQISVPEEVEGNDTISEANSLGLSADTPSVSLSGAVNEGSFDPGEDVDFYSFNLEAGQTVGFDIDTEEVLQEDLNFRQIVFPALSEMSFTPDLELRLFDAEGNELAINSDGAAPDEAFSRDPYLEFTADSAGTYYLGVSGLGNRNYDPNVARSGSAWTFPEVGVFFGPYELTVSLTTDTSEREGWSPGDSFDLVTPPPMYEGELSEGELANAEFEDQLEGAALLEDLQAGGYVIYFRHARTERDFADQVTADVTDFSTQRVLSEFGIQQSLAIGEGFELSNIPYDDVITSEYGRAIKTAAIAFGEYQKDSDLNFLPFEDYTDEQVEEMRVNITPFLTEVPEAGTNTIIVGHDDLFEAGTGIYPDPQGIAYLLKPDGNGEFEIIANLLPEEWAELSETVENGGDTEETVIAENDEDVNGWTPGDSFDLVTPPPTYEGELSDGEQANAEFEDQLEGAELLEELQDGGHVIYFRHARTEQDFADQVTADVNNFATQRVVSEFGVQQSLAIGEGFELGNIPYDDVITSDYGRAIETAAIAFGEYQKDSDLNFLPFEDYTDEQIEEMRANVTPFLTEVPEEGTNTIIVGHDDLFEAGTGIYPDPQGIAYVLTPDGEGSFEVIANLLPEEWVELSEGVEGTTPTDGDDVLNGGEDDDLIAGLLGDDTLYGNGGDDVLRGDLNSRSPGGSVGGDDVISGGDGNDQIGGKGGNDLLSGDAGDDLIWGDDGNDTIMGVTGDDTLTGDDFSGGSGSDLFVFGNGDGTDTITDFDPTEDMIGLVEGELSFEDIEIIELDGNVAINVIETEETLVVLDGIEASELTEELFLLTSDISLI